MKTKWMAVAAPLALIAVGLIVAVPAYPYLFQGSGSGTTFTPIRWPAGQISWVINPSITGTTIVGNGNVSVTTVMTNSFATWTTAPNTSLSMGAPGTSTISNLDSTPVPAGTNLVCFQCTGSSLHFTNDGTLAVTITQSSGSTITWGRIFFNPNPSVGTTSICFTTDGTACAASGAVAQLMQPVATHEIGHFFGLGHSAVTSATMYPFAGDDSLETLGYDDLAAISTLYPASTPTVQTGSISGTVTLNGANVFGAHVFANSTTNANPFVGLPIRKTPIGMLTFPNGAYIINGVPPDSYELIAEPLDFPVSDSDVATSWADDWTQTSVNTSFTTRWR